MENSKIFSRRDTDRKVDFRPDLGEGSPYDQARRLSAYLEPNAPHNLTDDNITDCPAALDALREYQYRKIFGGTTHEQFLETDKEYPEAIDWLIRVHEIESSNFQTRKQSH